MTFNSVNDDCFEYLLLVFFRLKIPNKYCKSSRRTTYEAKHPKSYQNAFSNPKGYDTHPRPPAPFPRGGGEVASIKPS